MKTCISKYYNSWIFENGTDASRLIGIKILALFGLVWLCFMTDISTLVGHFIRNPIHIYIYIYIYIYTPVISTQRPKTMCGLFTNRIYEEFHIILWECSMYGYCYIFLIQVYKLLWEPYTSPHNGLFSPLLVLRDFAAREVDHFQSVPLQLPGSTSAGRVICGTDLADCVSVPGDFLRPQGAFPQAFTSFRGGYCPAPEAPLIRGIPTGP